MMMEKVSRLLALNSRGMLPCGLKMSGSNRLEMTMARLANGRSLNLL